MGQGHCDRCFQFDRQIDLIAGEIREMLKTVRRPNYERAEWSQALEQLRSELTATQALYDSHRKNGPEHR
jgi:hypothetical protein